MISKKPARQRHLLILFFAAALFVLAADVDGQTKKRKRTVTQPAVTLPAGEPQIISRAEDFPDTESQTIIPVQASETAAASNAELRSATMEELGERIRNLENSNKRDRDNDAKQKRLLLNLDILTRAEQRSETLRKQLFEMIEKESATKTKLEQIDNDIRPESIDRSVAFAGSLRPEDLRNMRRKNLEVEKTNLQSLLAEIQRTKTVLDQNLQNSEMLVERLRVKLEKDIEDALAADEQKNN